MSRGIVGHHHRRPDTRSRNRFDSAKRGGCNSLGRPGPNDAKLRAQAKQITVSWIGLKEATPAVARSKTIAHQWPVSLPS
jgi:hypothetical protein